MKRLLFSGCIAAAIAIAGCGGGGFGSATPVAKTSAAPQIAQGKFVIVVPAGASTSSVNPEYVSRATHSVSFQLPSMPSSQVVTLALGSSSCPLANGNYTCTATFNAPVGDNQALTVKTFASSDGSGSVLSMNTVPINVSLTADNSVTVTLNGVAVTLELALGPDAANQGTAESITASWTAQDAAGQTIIGPGTITDASGNAVTPAISASPAAGITIGAYDNASASWAVNYDGSSGSNVVFTVKYTGLTDGTDTLVVTPTATASPTPTSSPASGNAIVDGDFATGSLAPWYLCYAAHHVLTAQVNASPSPLPTGQVAPDTAAGTPRPATTATPLVSGLGTQGADATVQSTTPTGDTNGFSFFALVGHSNYPYNGKGTVGICQDVTVPATNPTLSFAMYEGGNDWFVNADTEAEIYPSGSFVANGGVMQSTATPAPLFAENNCWNNIYVSGDTTHVASSGSTRANGCNNVQANWTGGRWYQRTFDLTSYANQPVTVFLGLWRSAASGSPSTTTYFNYTYFGNVTLTSSSSPAPTPTPTATPAALTASTSSLTLSATGPASFTVTETGYRGSFTVVSSNTAVVTVTTPVTASSDTTTINITAVGAGTANVTVTDASNQHAVVAVGVTTSPITIQSHGGGR